MCRMEEEEGTLCRMEEEGTLCRVGGYFRCVLQWLWFCSSNGGPQKVLTPVTKPPVVPLGGPAYAVAAGGQPTVQPAVIAPPLLPASPTVTAAPSLPQVSLPHTLYTTHHTPHTTHIPVSLWRFSPPLLHITPISHLSLTCLLFPFFSLFPSSLPPSSSPHLTLPSLPPLPPLISPSLFLFPLTNLLYSLFP